MKAKVDVRVVTGKGKNTTELIRIEGVWFSTDDMHPFEDNLNESLNMFVEQQIEEASKCTKH